MGEREALERNLYGADSHVHAVHALEGLTARDVGARPAGLTHSIYQLLQHMIYWQDIGIARVRGAPSTMPSSSAEGWTAAPAPASQAVWDEGVRSFTDGLEQLEGLLPSVDLDRVVEPDRQRTARQNVLMVMGHNSYHLGQIVQIRQLLGKWPPPKGGDSW